MGRFEDFDGLQLELFGLGILGGHAQRGAEVGRGERPSLGMTQTAFFECLGGAAEPLFRFAVLAREMEIAAEVGERVPAAFVIFGEGSRIGFEAAPDSLGFEESRSTLEAAGFEVTGFPIAGETGTGGEQQNGKVAHGVLPG